MFETISLLDFFDKEIKLHRTDGPAYIEYDSNNTIWKEEWHIDGQRHRLDGPAGIIRSLSKNTLCNYWFNKGIIHRIDGPAFCQFDANGKLLIEHWYVNQIYISKEWLTENNIDPYNISKEDQFLISMRF